MMTYKKMLEEAQKNGTSSEKIMWQSVAGVEMLLADIKEAHPQLYWDFMRKQHEILYKGHYGEEFAAYDISKLQWVDSSGEEHTGGYWTKDQVLEASKGLPFPAGTTDCDKWVAFNSMYADLARISPDTDIIKVAYEFYFNDVDFDYTSSGKIWKYMSCI